MTNISDLEKISDEGLDVLESLLLNSTKEELIIEINRIKKQREERKEKTANDIFLVDWLNIDPDLILKLKNNGIFNMTQLLEADLSKFSVVGSEARNQYEYARGMFDFTPQEELKRRLGREITDQEFAESIVNQVNVDVKGKRK